MVGMLTHKDFGVSYPHGDISPWRKMFYGPKPLERKQRLKRLIPEVIEHVDELALAIWMVRMALGQQFCETIAGRELKRQGLEFVAK